MSIAMAMSGRDFTSSRVRVTTRYSSEVMICVGNFVCWKLALKRLRVALEKRLYHLQVAYHGRRLHRCICMIALANNSHDTPHISNVIMYIALRVLGLVIESPVSLSVPLAKFW